MRNYIEILPSEVAFHFSTLWIWLFGIFAKRSQYISIKNPFHRQSEKACMCFKTRRAYTRDYTVLRRSLMKVIHCSDLKQQNAIDISLQSLRSQFKAHFFVVQFLSIRYINIIWVTVLPARDHPFRTSANFSDFWYPPPPCLEPV